MPTYKPAHLLQEHVLQLLHVEGPQEAGNLVSAQKLAALRPWKVPQLLLERKKTQEDRDRGRNQNHKVSLARSDTLQPS